jgi:phosphoribosylamine--glycine ligase/phosphoribosylformylglycinamidine cyclo-ligase
MSRIIYIHPENSSRYSALVKHIKLFHENYNINDTIENIIANKNYLFILNENAILQYGEYYNKLVGDSNCIYPINNASVQLEISKSYCREFINKIGLGYLNPSYQIIIPSQGDLRCDIDCVNKVIKADGLESGKGVFVYNDHFKTNNDALLIINKLLKKHNKVLVEEKLIGHEFSLISISWKGNITHFPLVKDFKRLHNNDRGANTGGMGTISFPGGLMPFISAEEYKQCCDINEDVIYKSNFTGFLYGSFMKTVSGEIKLIEYNVRLGDSEAVNILGLLESSLIDYLDDPIKNPLVINKNKYTYFRYLVPKHYPYNNSHSHSHSYNSIVIDEKKYIIVNPELPNNIFYKANCFNSGLPNVYEINNSRTCGIFTMNTDINYVIEDNDIYTKMIYGDLHYRTDIGTYFIKDYSQKDYLHEKHRYINHLNNYNHIITNTKSFIDDVNNNIQNRNPNIKVIGKIGDFANSIQYIPAHCIKPEEHSNIKIICSVDGAGTKTKFLEYHPNRFHILGNDIVIHNINDMYCNNGIPIALLDYYGCDKLNKDEFNQFITGVMEICELYGIPLIGGETAEMRGIFSAGEIEVLGILLGIIPNDKDVSNGLSISKGNYIYGISSNGAHTNGYTKLREIAHTIEMPSYIREFFSQPHKCYVNIMNYITTVLQDYYDSSGDSGDSIMIVGKAHITGGGFVDNIERIFPVDKDLHIKLDKWKLEDEWQWVYDNSGMMWEEFIRVFNAGWGFCFITNKPIPDNIVKLIYNDYNEKIKILGIIE